jgi:hypothetical protein
MESDSIDDVVGDPSMKQLIPVYGFYRALRDSNEGKPSLCEDADRHLLFYGGAVYHALAIPVVVKVGAIVYELLKRM